MAVKKPAPAKRNPKQKGPAAKQARGTDAAYLKKLAAMELLVRAGKLTFEEIGKKCGVTKGRVSQLATEHGWTQDLAPRIKARAQAKVDQSVAVAEKAAAGEEGVVEANAEAQARIILGERALVARCGRILVGLLDELEGNTKPARAGAHDVAKPKALDLVARVDINRKLVETMKSVIVLERVVQNITEDTPIDPSRRVAEAVDNGFAGLKAQFDKKLGKA